MQVARPTLLDDEIDKKQKSGIAQLSPTLYTGSWRTLMGTTECRLENFASGRYRFSPTCPTPFSEETGRSVLFTDGTWMLVGDTGRIDRGTYLALSPTQTQMTGTFGTAIWARTSDR